MIKWTKCHQTHAVLFLKINNLWFIMVHQFRPSHPPREWNLGNSFFSKKDVVLFLGHVPNLSNQFRLWTRSRDTPYLVSNGKTQQVMSKTMMIVLVIWLQVVISRLCTSSWNGCNFQEEWIWKGSSFLDMEAKQNLLAKGGELSCWKVEEFSDELRSSWQKIPFNQTQSTLHITSS